MKYFTLKQATRLMKALKNTLQNEYGEETRLNHCCKAVAEALNFDGEFHMRNSLPCETTWNGEWCINHLVDNGYVTNARTAELAVRSVEERLRNILSATAWQSANEECTAQE